jgi:hypothetical protein
MISTIAAECGTIYPAVGIFEQCTYDEQCTIAAELEMYLG